MRLTDYIRVVRQRLGLAIVVVACVALASLGFSITRKPVYEAATKLQLKPAAPGSDISEFLKGAQLQTDLATEAELVKSTDVAARVLQRVPLKTTPDNLLKLVSTSAVPNAQILIVIATSPNPQLSMNLANAFAEEYVATRRADARKAAQDKTATLQQRVKTLETDIDALTRQIKALPPGSFEAQSADAARTRKLTLLQTYQNTLDVLTDTSQIDSGVGKVVQAATQPIEKGKSSPAKNLLLGLLVGIPMALGVVLLLDTMSDTVRTKEDAERTADAPVLGMIPFDDAWNDPDHARLASRTEPFSPAAEAHRALRLNIEHAASRTGARRIMITSAGPSEGKSVTAANLALAFADAKRPVVLVDADLRRPRAHAFFEVEPSPGLVDVIEDEVPVERALRRPHPDLTFLPSGTPTERPDLLFLHGDLDALFEHLEHLPTESRRRPVTGRRAAANGNGTRKPPHLGPAVLIDAPPVLQAAEVSALAGLADGVVLVVQAGVTARLAATRAAEQVRRAGGEVLGVVLVGVRSVVEPGFEATYEYRPRTSGRTTPTTQEV